MNKVLRVLIIEDVLADVVLINSELRRGGLSFRSKRVESKEAFLEEIQQETPDVILADHGLPTFDSFTALTIAQKECPSVPFIFVTGALGEEMAIETMKSGATDYVLKNHLQNLVPAIKRALRQAEERTKLRETERALRASEEHFRMLVEGVRDYAIFMLDTQGRITCWNAGAEWMENYRADEILGRPFSHLYSDSEAASKQPEQALRVATAQGRFEEEGWRVRKSGGRFWAKTVITPLRSEERKLRGFAVVMQDLTQQRQLEENWKRYEAIVNTAKDLFSLIDAEGRYVAVNEAYCRAHRKTRQEIIGKSVAEIWGEQVFHQAIREPLQRSLRGEEVRYQARFAFPALGERLYEVSYYPYTQEEAVMHVIVVTHDITELHPPPRSAELENDSLEQRVARRTEELRAAYQEMETLCYSISHDLRAPLRHIDGFVELLQQEVADHLNADCSSYLRTIAESAQQMGKLIDELLAFATMGRAEFRPLQLDLGELFNSVREELNDQAAGRDIEWIIRELPVVFADPTLLRQALVNLLSNALKFTRDRPQARLEIGGTATAEETVVFIRDNGVGFDVKYAHKLFGVFQKLHSAQRFEGLGIGLAKVHRIIQRHGGRTWAEGAEDKGATFYFALPNPPKA
ncbi:MAG: PAS domain S-box protein [Verrucomicrobia bacterium]|nr:PAS domain S-box protein [Verrucomicrobiota bacterium]